MHNYGLYVPLTTDEFDRLRDLARAERRPLRDQAAVLLAGALEAQHEEQRSRIRSTLPHQTPVTPESRSAPAVTDDEEEQVPS